MEKRWLCSSCEVLYFTRSAVVHHINQVHSADINAKPECVTEAKPASCSPKLKLPPPRPQQVHRFFGFVKLTLTVENMPIKPRSARSVVELLCKSRVHCTAPLFNKPKLAQHLSKGCTACGYSTQFFHNVFAPRMYVLERCEKRLPSQQLIVLAMNLKDFGVKTIAKVFQTNSQLRHFGVPGNFLV